MMIFKITPSVGYNKLLKRLNIQLDEPTNQKSIKVPKVKANYYENVIIKVWGLV